MFGGLIGAFGWFGCRVGGGGGRFRDSAAVRVEEVPGRKKSAFGLNDNVMDDEDDIYQFLQLHCSWS
jgi:hypothetical protein